MAAAVRPRTRRELRWIRVFGGAAGTAMWAGSMGDNATQAAGIAPGLIRIVLRLEDPEDLRKD
jgi:cystathionine beta-lyase/cystathionine gamma-synthase